MPDLTVEEQIALIEKIILFFIEVAKNTGAFPAMANEQVQEHVAALEQKHAVPPTSE